MFKWDESFISYVNLPDRTDRLDHMIKELDKADIFAERTIGMYPHQFDRHDPDTQVQWNRTPGSIGCMESQMNVMRKAYDRDKSAIVLEDDVVLCSDFKKRMDYLQHFLNFQKNWDVAWLGGTVHINPPYWHIGGANPDLPGTKLTKDAEPTWDPRIIKCWGAFSTHAYIVNYDSIQKVLNLLELVKKESMGIDWSFIRISYLLQTYMFLPGMVKQMDNRSSIGQGDTIFSGFSKLGPYWWQDTMDEFDPSTIVWPKGDEPKYFGDPDYLTYYMNKPIK